MDQNILFAIISPFFSSIATIFQSVALKTLSPLIVVSFSALIGSLIIFSIVLISREKINFRKLRRNSGDLIYMALLRPLFGAVMFSFGLSMTTAIKAIFFTKMEPYFVLGWNWILHKEKIQLNQAILLLIHVMGAIILSTGGALESFGKTQIGDLLIIISMGFFSLSYVYGSRLSKNVGAKLTNAIILGIAGVILLPFAFLFLPSTTILTNPTGWIYLLANVIFFNVIGLTLWIASLKSVKGWMVSALRSLGPIIGAPVAWLLLGETLSQIQIVGAVIVLITSVLIAREHNPKSSANKK